MLPRNAQVYAWQMSVLFLTFSVLAMITGMFILIWSSTGGFHLDEPWWNSHSKLAVSFTIVFCVIASLFVFEQVTLYSWHGKDDSDDDRQAMDRSNGEHSSYCAHTDEDGLMYAL